MYEWGKAPSGTSLLRVLLDKGYITPDQEDQLLGNAQGETATPQQKKPKGEDFFGDIAVRKGFTNRDRLSECLEEQKKKGIPLGALMVMKGYLTLRQVEEITSSQKTKLVHCPTCRLAFSLKTATKIASVKCPRCKGALVDRPIGAAAPLQKNGQPVETPTLHCPVCFINYPQESGGNDAAAKCIRCQKPLVKGEARLKEKKEEEKADESPTPPQARERRHALPVASPTAVSDTDPVGESAPAPAANPKALIKHESNEGMAFLDYSLDGKRTEKYEIVKEVTTLGRSPLCDLPLVDFMLSRCHCEIRRISSGVYRLVDLKSKNGTYVNRRPIGSVEIKNGDHITLGEVTVTFKIKKKK